MMMMMKMISLRQSPPCWSSRVIHSKDNARLRNVWQPPPQKKNNNTIFKLAPNFKMDDKIKPPVLYYLFSTCRGKAAEVKKKCVLISHFLLFDESQSILNTDEWGTPRGVLAEVFTTIIAIITILCRISNLNKKRRVHMLCLAFTFSWLLVLCMLSCYWCVHSCLMWE